MRKLLFLIFLFLIVLGVLFILQQINKSGSKQVTSPIVSPTKAVEPSKVSQALFVPYWTIGSKKINAETFDRLVYFGINVSDSGIDTTDAGYKNIDTFLKQSPQEVKKLITVRMINSKQNFDILESKTIQKNIINQAIEIAKQNNFNGIVLDLELSSLPFNSVVSNINDFVDQFQTLSKAQHLTFGMTIFGDNFYRIRPYDVSYLGKHVDEIFIMAYDFHKANGDPGPNFPLQGKDFYGYDFETMMNDFLNLVPLSKNSVVFGFFGYDWVVDANNKALKPGSAVSYNEIAQKYLHCQSCVVTKEPKSSETKVEYTDSQLQKHIIWFEDLSSVEKKKQFLKERGINSTAIWAYSYF